MYFAKELLDQSGRLKKKWEEEVRRSVARNHSEKPLWTTISGMEIRRLYTPEDTKDMDFVRDIGCPGQYPFLRGNQTTGYRGKYWTYRMLSGMGTAEETNRRWRKFLKEGQTGLSIPFDFPTLMGYDTDSPKARGECGKCGVAVDSLEDFLVLLDGIPMDKVTTSMTINPPATVIWAMYCAVADLKGIPLTKVSGTIQNDMLKEFIAQKTLMCPLDPSVKLVCDAVEFGVNYVPKWNTISISGYHIREAGSTAVQELAFTLRDGIEYVSFINPERRGLKLIHLHRDFPSSSTPILTSLKRLRNFGQRGGCGQKLCVTASRRESPGLGGCASIRRQQVVLLLLSSHTTTSCEPHWKPLRLS